MSNTIYVAGWKWSGYVPYGDVRKFDSFEDAQEFLVDEMHCIAKDTEDEAIADEILAAAKMAQAQTEPFEFITGRYRWWVSTALASTWRPADESAPTGSTGWFI